MQFSDLQNFYFIPEKGSLLKGILYELEEIEKFETNAFVLIPYANPQKEKIKTRFLRIKNVSSFSLPESNKKSSNIINLKAHTSPEAYLKKVKGLKEHIQQGDIYEINFCIQFIAENTTIDPLAVFLKLHALSKAPYSALLKIGDHYIISSSPELFLRKEGNYLHSKPIKGTIRRGQNEKEDLELKNELLTSFKERTENVMAVDVARNDLSIIASKGTVSVNKLYNIESFETVHQMVSTVTCELKENTSFEKILEATFPMASMTGAPKKRAMNLIDDFEEVSRNFYSGAMGIIDGNGDFELSVIIRSIFYNAKTQNLSIHVGSAITYLSDPEKEYEECLLKAKAMLNALNGRILT